MGEAQPPRQQAEPSPGPRPPCSPESQRGCVVRAARGPPLPAPADWACRTARVCLGREGWAPLPAATGSVHRVRLACEWPPGTHACSPRDLGLNCLRPCLKVKTKRGWGHGRGSATAPNPSTRRQRQCLDAGTPVPVRPRGSCEGCLSSPGNLRSGPQVAPEDLGPTPRPGSVHSPPRDPTWSRPRARNGHHRQAGSEGPGGCSTRVPGSGLGGQPRAHAMRCAPAHQHPVRAQGCVLQATVQCTMQMVTSRPQGGDRDSTRHGPGMRSGRPCRPPWPLMACPTHSEHLVAW